MATLKRKEHISELVDSFVTSVSGCLGPNIPYVTGQSQRPKYFSAPNPS
jgi:hypothetical protein